jgi:hypothetical protein
LSTPYNANPANVSLGTAVQVTIPQDGVDTESVASINTPIQKSADYIEAIRSALSTSGAAETFDAATFPPTSMGGGWSAPSTRFGSDSAYVRDTGTPITGTASANRPGSQTASTTSSMGLSTFFLTPGRFIFEFKVTCNINAGDHLDLYIDGVLTGKWYSATGPTTEGGRYVSEILPAGAHTFDWRFVRGASASVGGEAAKIDNVQVVPDFLWLFDPARLYWIEDFVATANSLPPNWTAANNNGNAGTINSYGSGDLAAAARVVVGLIEILNAATVIGDTQGIAPTTGVMLSPGFTPSALLLQPSVFPFVESVCGCVSLTSIYFSSGLSSAIGPGTTEPTTGTVTIAFDSAISANWLLRCGATDRDTGIAATVGLHRFGLSVSPLGVIATIDGVSVPGSTTTFMSNPTVPAAGLLPHFQVASRTATGARKLIIDQIRVYANRA